MRRLRPKAASSALILALPLFLSSPARSAQVAGHAAPTQVVIYNSDLALVRESLLLKLAKGTNDLTLDGIPRRIDSTSVHLQGADFRVARQSFRYDLWNADRVFHRFLGDSIAYRYMGKAYRGRLAGIDGDDIFIERRDSVGVLTMLKRSQISELEFPSKLALATRPSLTWTLESGKGGDKAPAALSYLTSGIQWTAEYAAELDKSETGVTLSGWATIVNRSGSSYEAALVSLVAGDVHRSGETPDRGPAVESAEASPAGPSPVDLFAYHLYSVDGAVDLRYLETIQAPLFAPTRVAARRAYVYDGARDGSKVRVKVELGNDKEQGLGIPLPAGRVRVFAPGPSGTPLLVGEDAIGHTPAGEKIKILSGTAFDLVGERTRVSHTRVSRSVTEDQYRVAIRNRGVKPTTVTVVETLYGNWEIAAKSAEYRKKDAETVEFDVAVPAGRESVLTYTVRFTY